MIKAGIIGSTGYAGGELVRILTGHKEAEIKWYGSRSYIDQNYADVYRNLFKSWMRSVWMITWTRWQIRWM